MVNVWSVLKNRKQSEVLYSINISLSGEESREEKQYSSYIIQTYIVQTWNQNSKLYNSMLVRYCCHELGNTMVVTAHNMHMLDIQALHILGKLPLKFKIKH